MTNQFSCTGNFCARVLALLLFTGTVLRLEASDQQVYTDSLQNSWQNYSWATVNFANTSPVHGGTDSISVTSTNYQALYLHHAAQDATQFTNITFWVNGGATGGQVVLVQATSNGIPITAVALAALPVNSWRQQTISLAALGVAKTASFDGFWIQVQNSGASPTFYVDDVTLVAVPSAPVVVTVNAQLNAHPISPMVYGTAFASSNQVADLNFTMDRSGGNNETRYNWQINAHNLDADYYFESYPDSSATPGATADAFVAGAIVGGAQPMITIPMIGWAPKLGAGRSINPSYSVAKYGAQTSVDPYHTDCGNGVSTNSVTHTTSLIITNDPNDANVPVDSTFEQGYVQHLIGNWGNSTNGGVKFYLMDNEHSLWQSTHRDIHPIGPTMQEIYNDIVTYAGMVKSNDPDALVCGPEEWGWPGYFNSGYDIQNPGGTDRAANGGMDYMPWLLNQLHQHDTNTGIRLLDFFTLHCYPQEGNVGTSATDASTVALRNQSTRQFWDTNYVDPSWINSIIMLIPRMKTWVTNYYPGTKIGITEYNWGAEPDISGATAQADLLGIFGRENLDLATRWTTPDASTPTYKAMKIYRNYDGNKSTFGDTSVSATGPNPDYVSSFAAVRSSDGALTIMAINKQIGSNTPATFVTTNFLPGGTAQVWQLTSANTISRLSDISFTGGTFSNTLPAQSVTLFVLPAGTPPVLQSSAISSTNTFSFSLNGQSGQRYAIQASSNLLNWQSLQTNVLSGSSAQIVLPATNADMFYRAQWLP
jgi:hypothetical protein